MSKIPTFAFWCGLAAVLVGCERSEIGTPEPRSVSSTEVVAMAHSRGGIRQVRLESEARLTTGKFKQLTGEQTGLNFTNELRPHNMRKYLLNGAGLATGDFDNDGLVDVYAISQDGPNRLFRQTSPWQFEDITTMVGDLTGGDYKGTGAAFVDVDNDGWLDLYACNIDGPNLLFMNQGNGRFVEEAQT